MKVTELTKLNAAGAAKVVDALQQLLADYQVYYTNLRGFHWNVKGKDFFVLHEQYEKMYDDAAAKIDEIAERILMLDGVPAHNFSQYLQLAKVKETAYAISRFKGLGEMNHDQLKDTTMHPDTRRLLQARIPDFAGEATLKTFTKLMGKGEAASRRAWIEAEGDQANVDI